MDAIVTQMIILFILVIIGYYLSKKKMMDADFDRKLSGLVINVTCPSLILWHYKIFCVNGKYGVQV